MSLERCQFLLGCQISWHILFHSSLMVFLYLCSIHWDFSFFISYFVYLKSFSLLGESGQRFVSFIYPLKEPALGFIDFFFFFLKLLVTSSQIFMISLLLLTLGVVCSFSNSFRWWAKLFEIFLLFEEGLYHYELASMNCFCGVT